MEPRELARNRPGLWRPQDSSLLALGVALLLLASMAVLLFLSWPAAAAGPTYVYGPILDDETWTLAGSPYVVTDTVTIVSTASLTIDPGVSVQFEPDTGLVAEGPLTAIGTPGSPISFTSALAEPPPNAWDGLYLVGSNNTLQHCRVEYGRYGLNLSAGSDRNLVADCSWWWNGDWAIPAGGTIFGSTDQSQFLRNEIAASPFGLLLIKSSANLIADNELYYLDGLGIGLQGTVFSPGVNNVVSGNGLGHIGGEGLSFLYQANLTVSDNWLYRAAETPGLGSVESALTLAAHRPEADGLTEISEAGGLSVRSSDGVLLTGNHVTESGWGAAPSYRAGVFISETVDLTFDGNFVHLNRGNGLQYAALNGGSPTIQNNAFWDNEAFELESYYLAGIDVIGNWWGSNSPAPGTHFSGTLSYAPWVTLTLAAQPSLVPADGVSQAALAIAMLDGAGHHAPDGMNVGLETSLGVLSADVVSTTSGLAAANLTAPLAPGTAWLTATAPPPLVPPALPERQAYAWVSFVLTGAHTLNLTADPAAIAADGVSSSTLTAEVLNVQDAPVDDGTVVVFSTTLGTFPGGLALTTEPTGVTTIEAESTEVDKVGTWNSLAQAGASGGFIIYSRQPGARASYTFTGTAVSVLFQKEYRSGIAYVYLDGVLYRQIDTYWDDGTGTGRLYQQEEPIAEHLSYAPHTVDVVVSGLKNPNSANSYVGVDAFRIYGHERNGAYLTSGGVSTITLTSIVTPGTALATACAYPVCDTVPVLFRPAETLVLLPIVRRDVPVEPTPPPDAAYLSDVAANPETGLVYVASPQLDAVFAVDPAGEGSIVATIPVGDHPLGLAVMTTTNKIYAANLNSWTLTAIRGSDHARIADIYVGAQACKATADAGDARVYVTNHLESDNGAAAIDSRTDTFIYYYSRLHATQGRYGIAVDPKRDQLFIAARDAGLIAIQDAYQPNQDPQVFKLDPPRVPYVVAFNPTTGHLFVTAADDNVVVVLDPYQIEWSRARLVLYRGRLVHVIDRANAGWIAEVGVGLEAEEGIAVNPRTNRVYVTNAGSDTLSVLADDADPAQIRWLRDIAVGQYPQGVAVDPQANTIYVGNADSRDLTVIDGATNSVVKTIPLD